MDQSFVSVADDRTVSGSRAYKRYLLGLLMTILAFNYLDRIALGIVLQNVKTDLSLTDTQLGFLTGIAFALFYSVMGLPIARWADRGNRVLIISLTTFVWSIAVGVCGLARSFVELMLIRVAVAVGEAGCIPPAHSLIPDNFERAERPRAVSRYMLGVPLSLTGYFAAGWLNQLYGWRATFAILGLPGIFLAALVYFTLKEPRRLQPGHTRLATQQEPGFHGRQPDAREVYSALWSKPTFRHLLICFSVWYFFGYGLLQWTPTFFIRSHGLHTGELGSWFAVVYGVGGMLGIYLGGEWAARYAAGKERLQLLFCAVAFVIFAALNAFAFLVPSYQLAFAGLAVGAMGGNMGQGPVLATMQTLVPPRMRALSIALVYLFANLIGMGLGPLAAGALSDALRAMFGNESLRYALVILCPGYIWAAWHLWRASRSVAHDLKVVQDDSGNTIAPRRWVAAK